MSRKIKEILQSTEDRESLEQGYKTGETHGFRQRCKMILLKSEGHAANQIALILGSNRASVYNWLSRYELLGIAGLPTKTGQGRKPILEPTHISIVRAVVEQERQRLSQAHKSNKKAYCNCFR